MSNTYTFDGIRSIDGTRPPMLPFTVTWETDWDNSDGRNVVVTTPDGQEWTVLVHQDDSAESPRNPDCNLTKIYAYTGGAQGYQVILNELEGGDDPAAEALFELIAIHGGRNFDAIERRFNKWAALKGDPHRIMEHSSQGYSQSDWSKWIVLHNGETDPDWVRDELDVYDNYLIGDVYGYEIEATGGSCYGFFGDDWAKNGAMDYIAAELRHHILKEQERLESAREATRRARESAVSMVRHFTAKAA